MWWGGVGGVFEMIHGREDGRTRGRGCSGEDLNPEATGR